MGIIDNSIYGIKTIFDSAPARIELYLFGEKTSHQFTVDEIINLLQEHQTKTQKHTVILTKPISINQYGDNIISDDFKGLIIGSVLISPKYCEIENETAHKPALYSYDGEICNGELMPLYHSRIKEEIPIGTPIYFLDPIDFPR